MKPNGKFSPLGHPLYDAVDVHPFGWPEKPKAEYQQSPEDDEIFRLAEKLVDEMLAAKNIK